MEWFSLYSIMCLSLFLFHSLSCYSASPSCRPDQSSALLHFKNSFTVIEPEPNFIKSIVCDHSNNIVPYPKTSTWKNGTNCCLWDGVTCNTFGHVIGLNLNCSCLLGKLLPNNTLFHLTHLQSLDLSFNDFQESHISSNFSQLVSLTHLYLWGSKFSGEVPSQISHLHKLVSLEINGDSLSLKPNTWERLVKNLTHIKEIFLTSIDMSFIPLSHIFKNLSSSLESLLLGSTRLQGNLDDIIPFPPHLQDIDLSDNVNLTGYFPNTNWSNSLRSLYLSNTSLFGELPHNIGHMKFLNELSLSLCQFVGKIPESFWNLTQLTYLDLSNNHFEGHLPASLGNFTQLTFLSLFSNNFSGQISSSLSNLQNLSNLFLSNNHFEGHLPAFLGNLTQLTDLDVSSNNFSGQISSSLSNLQNLYNLDLSNNHFEGYFPAFLGNLTQLNDLRLNNNNFSGQILSSLLNFPNLTTLSLSSNNFSGHLPNEITGFSLLAQLSLSHNQLNGTIPSWCFTLPSLGILDLSSNQFTGQMGKISSYSLYRLDVSNNKLSGSIPSSIFYLEYLAILNLSKNNLTGIVHLHHLSRGKMNSFDLSSNLLQGELTSSICNVSSLIVINLSHNNFNGTIPQCIGSSSLALSVLDLQMNRFSGTIPESFEVGNNLRTLNLNGNLLEGSLPQSLVNCTMLEVLDIGKNRIEDTFPLWLHVLEELQVLVLRGNKLHGSIPILKDKTMQHAFPKLRVIDLSNNNLSGHLPAAFFKSFKAMKNVDEGEPGLHYMGDENYGSQYHDTIEVTMKGLVIHLEKILTIFTTIDLSNNMFDGKIPQVVGELGALKGLNFSHNRLTGAIPSSLGNLRNLEWLDLSSNNFSGKIPSELTNLNFLSFLNLSQNQLEGCIPGGQQFETFLNDSFKGNKGLRGSQIMIPCIIHKEKQPPQPSASFEVGIEFGWKPVLLGYVCGAAFGAAMFRVVIFTGKPQWIATMANDPPKKKRGRIRNRRS